MNLSYEPVIGLEVHIQLSTQSKIFCSCSTSFGAQPNSQVCPICLGMPGVLPVLNRQVVDYAICLGLATNSHINQKSVFARKNYFYPDLPKGYQISQFEQPFCENGYINIELDDASIKKIRLNRIHAEEDAGKSMHAEAYVGSRESLVDLNRCGVPLLEIVSEPDLKSPREAYHYLVSLRQLVRYLGICDGNMEEGSLRCDANVSVRPVGETRLGIKSEVKNMNSFNSVERALEYEIQRQIDLLQKGEKLLQETRLWDADRGITESMRSKEYSHDYRYFPEPDLVPIQIDEVWIKRISEKMPELPLAKKQRFIQEYGLPAYDASILTEDLGIAAFYEKAAGPLEDKKLPSNWVMGEVIRALKENPGGIHELPLAPEKLSELLVLVQDKVINNKIAKKVFDELLKSDKSPKAIVEEKGWLQISDSDELSEVIDQVIQSHIKDVKDYLAGNAKVLGFLMGQVMRLTKGQANPQTVNQLLRAKLNQMR
ncbi:Asp-tRNA(Asn)/Glu-tRNA(Gln) amidotransferase subunit GatB [candidate division KSB1 bacterium]|nr:Asp-tRNA(Asn)/Glu-tRNA(Gln) amidotransferase subunit GatB [candidate division KSB1 bacterium]